MKVEHAADFGRVAVVMGGTSRERQVSLWSGEAVLAALQSRGVNAFGVDGIPALLQHIHAKEVDRVFIILHGPGGEDGTCSAVLEDERQLFRMQFGVDRHGHKTGVPGGQ